MSTPETIKIDDITYVRSDSLINSAAENKDGLIYSIVRTYSAGVFAGYVKSAIGKEVILIECRRLWRWYGAMSLSELAINGTTEPDKCKFSVPTSNHYLSEGVEIIPCTVKSRESIQGVKVWVK
jgi:hypothetical protein